MKKFSFVVIALFFSLSAFADRGGERWEEKKIACEGKTVEDECSVNGRNGIVTGKCIKGKRDASLLICKTSRRGKREFQVLKELNLSEKQIAELQTFMKKHQDKKEQLMGDNGTSRDKMKQFFIKGKSDEEFRKLHEETSISRKNRGQLKLEKMIFLKNLLTEEQRKVFIEKGGSQRRHGPKESR